MPPLNIPCSLSNTIDAHNKWLQLLQKAEEVIKEDITIQDQAARGIRIKERRLPPELIGRSYAQYCQLINRMYDAYLNSVHLQRARYMLVIVALFMKRMFELRKELVHIIVTDYIYVDAALTQLRMTPFDIQVVVPFHYPLECRSDTIEQLLQQMWADAIKRKNKPPKKPKEPKPPPEAGLFDDEPAPLPQEPEEVVEEESEEEEEIIQPSEHTIIPEEYIQTSLIQKHERFRQWYLKDYKTKCMKRKMYFAKKGMDAPLEMRSAAAKLIQRVYREFMKRKRQKLLDEKRDIILGLLPDAFKPTLKLTEENDKIYERRRNTRMKVEQTYLKEFEKENTRLILFKKEDQIDDITDHIREWFKEWYYGYGFFPQYPYELEGGTVLVIRGDYPTIEEKQIEDEKHLAATKGKTKEQLKQDRLQKALEDKIKAEAQKEKMKKEAEQLFKQRCNPLADPGYKAEESHLMDQMIEALKDYRLTWSLYDTFPPERYGETVYGFLKPLLTEELMCQLHKDCRMYVDELMRIDLKLLIKQHQIMYKRVGWKYPKMKPRKMPKAPPQHKVFELNDRVLTNLERIFDLNIITRPTAKISDVYGDLNYAAYDLNIQDPDVKYPLPGYGDIRRRLVLSCVYGCGIQPGCTRRKSVMLLGPERNGKSFLVDAVAGEMNAIKIDVSPECFTAVVQKPAKMLAQAFVAAKAFQPAVIFMKNVERVFYKKIPPQEKYLKANKLKNILGKFIKQVSADDKVIFIATCTNPFAAKQRPLVSIFDEIILVPRTDYGTLQRYFSEKLQRERSIPSDTCVQPIARLLQGFGFGIIREAYDAVMTPERIVSLNVTPLSPLEFLNVLLEREYEPVTLEEYQKYVNFFIESSPLRTARAQYDIINQTRDAVYKKLAKKQAEK